MYSGTATREPATPSPSLAPAAPRGRVLLALGAWKLGGLAIALSGVLWTVPQLLPLWVLGTLVGGSVAYRRIPAFRSFADGLDLRGVILVHVLRVPIGAYIVAESGVVPELFADRAGPGDIAAGLLALAAVAAVPVTTRLRRRALVAWCVFGMADLALAFGTAQYLLFVAGDPRMHLVGELPWALLPTLLVPLMLASHLLVLARVRRPH